MIAAVLDAGGLACCRGGRRLFENVALSLRPGRLLCVRGPNGSGKSTLLRVLCGLIQPDSGEVRWRGEPLRRVAAEFRASCSYLGHKDGIKAPLSAADNLRAAAALGGAGRAGAMSALAQLGAGHLAGTPCALLSAGQLRKVALARLLLRKTALWVLDEPAANLDERGAALLNGLVGRHLEDGGMALIAGHRQSGRLPAHGEVVLGGG